MPRRKRRTRYARYPPRWPAMLGWGLVLAVSLVAVLGIAYLVAAPSPGESGTAVDELLTTARMPGVAIALVFVALIFVALSRRKVLTERLAMRPGGIEVPTFTAGTGVEETDLERWTGRFRQRFAELHLNAPAAVPGGLADGDFLDVLAASGVDTKNWLGNILSLMRASSPRYAWRVTGMLVKRAHHPRYGVTFQVVRLPGAASPPATAWAASWDKATRAAADQATAAILPRTRLCVNQWASWRRFRMPGALLEAYENAAGFEAERRYDEALDSYFEAAEMDPMNMPLRLRIGQLQEKLGLYLDALATYQGMREVGAERRKRTREPRAARRERRRAMIVARYRRIVLLGGSQLAEQWRKTTREGADESRRDWRRRMLRERLRHPLERELARIARGHQRRGVNDPLSWSETFFGVRARSRRSNWSAEAVLAEPGRLPPIPKEDVPEGHPAREQARCEEEALYTLRELFSLAALRDLRGVLRELRPRPWERTRILSRDSVRLTAACIEVRLDWVQHVLAQRSSTAWPPTTYRLSAAVSQIEGVGRPFDLWHEHYNAACVFALPLLADDIRDDDRHAVLRDDLAELAVARLARATAHADSAYIAGRRDWLLSEDPDLDGLRTHEHFKDFEAMNLPARAPSPFRPLAVKTLESSRYVEALITETAASWEDAWHERGRHLRPNPDVHELLRWWNDERRAWELVSDVARNNRYWPMRVALLHGLRHQADTYGFDAPKIPFPHYRDRVLSEEELGPEDASRRHAAERIAEDTEDRLRAVGDVVCEALADLPKDWPPVHIDAWEEELRRLDARGREPRHFLVALLCDHHAALWQLLSEWVVADETASKRKQARFKQQMKDTEDIWCGAAYWWRNWPLVRSAVHRGVRPALVFRRRPYNYRNGKPSADAAPTLERDVRAEPGAG
jgi:hypothetical protein